MESTDNFFLLKGESFNGDLVVYNAVTQSYRVFQVDLCIYTDGIIDRNYYFLGSYNFTDGIGGTSGNNNSSISNGYEYV